MRKFALIGCAVALGVELADLRGRGLTFLAGEFAAATIAINLVSIALWYLVPAVRK